MSARARAKWKIAPGFWAVAMGFWILTRFIAVAETPAEATLRAWLEPKSEHQPVTVPILKAQRTEIALGRLGEEGLQPFSKAELEALGKSPDDLLELARANSAEELATLKPEYVRDRHKVIQYAELSSEQPIVASAVLAPGFLPLFKDTLGESVLVVVPNRYTAFVFPRLVTHYRDYYPMVFDAFHETAHPISVEVFEVNGNGIRAVGVYSRPGEGK